MTLEIVISEIVAHLEGRAQTLPESVPFRSETGIPLAIMNAAALTAQRTGAVGALGVKHMTPPDILSAGIVGCGVQGAWQAIFACAVRPIREVFVFSRSVDRFEQFAATVRSQLPASCELSARDGSDGRSGGLPVGLSSNERLLAPGIRIRDEDTRATQNDFLRIVKVAPSLVGCSIEPIVLSFGFWIRSATQHA